jgi:hypothetical protein
MSNNEYTTHTTHSKARSAERLVTDDQITAALADGYRTRQASGRWEVRGRNGTTVITDPTGEVLITVLPLGSRPLREVRANAGVSRHRPNRRGPKGRGDSRKPRR